MSEDGENFNLCPGLAIEQCNASPNSKKTQIHFFLRGWMFKITWIKEMAFQKTAFKITNTGSLRSLRRMTDFAIKSDCFRQPFELSWLRLFIGCQS